MAKRTIVSVEVLLRGSRWDVRRIDVKQYRSKNGALRLAISRSSYAAALNGGRFHIQKPVLDNCHY